VLIWTARLMNVSFSGDPPHVLSMFVLL